MGGVGLGGTNTGFRGQGGRCGARPLPGGRVRSTGGARQLQTGGHEQLELHPTIGIALLSMRRAMQCNAMAWHAYLGLASVT